MEMILRIKCIKFYVYKVKPETLKFVVVVFCLVVWLFVCFRFVYYYYYYYHYYYYYFFRTLNYISLGITCYHLNDIVS